MKYIYFHGGPGFNANPERYTFQKWMAQKGCEVILWEEPSLKRPSGPKYISGSQCFENYQFTLKKFFNTVQEQHPNEKFELIGFSFGAYAATYIFRNFPHAINKIHLISPCFNFEAVDRNLLNIGLDELEQSGKVEFIPLLKNVDEGSLGKLTPELEKAFGIILSETNFLNHYWRNHQAKDHFLQYYSGDEYEFDFTSFLEMRKTMDINLEKITDIPLHIYVGKYEKVIDVGHEVSMIKTQVQDPHIHTLSESAHYPHIEEF